MDTSFLVFTKKGAKKWHTYVPCRISRYLFNVLIAMPSVLARDCLFRRLAVSEHRTFIRLLNAATFSTLRNAMISFSEKDIYHNVIFRLDPSTHRNKRTSVAKKSKLYQTVFSWTTLKLLLLLNPS